MTSLAHYLLGNSRSAVLAALLLHPETSLHVRELARVSGTSPGSLHRELRALAELGLVLREEVGRQVNYRANTSCPVFEDLAGLLRKTVGVADVLRSAMMPIADVIDFAFVYGSVAAGEETARSDVDVMVLGQAGFGAVAQALASTHGIVRREVNATVMKAVDFKRKCKAGEGFALSVWRGPRIWLIGNEDDLAKLVEDRPA